MPKLVTFADQLRKAVGATDLTPYALAKRAGLTRQAVSNRLAGERQPNWETVQRLAAALGLDYRWFADPAIQAEVAAAPPAKGRGRPAKDEPATKPEAGRKRPTK
jgi:transcriptional regulator with XRE-family HTH domain